MKVVGIPVCVSVCLGYWSPSNVVEGSCIPYVCYMEVVSMVPFNVFTVEFIIERGDVFSGSLIRKASLESMSLPIEAFLLKCNSYEVSTICCSIDSFNYHSS